MKPQFELLEKFIDGDTSSEEAESVMRLIASDPGFQKEYKLRVGVNEAIKEKDIMELRYKLNMIYRQEITHGSGNIRHILQRNWHLAAASITILVIIGSFLLSHLNRLAPDKLFEQYYTSDAVFTTRSNDNNENLYLTLGLQKFQKQQYGEAILILKNIPDNIVSQYYLGISYIETNHFSKAKDSFNAILKREPNLFTEQAQWYKGLCLLKLNQITEASEIFTSINNSNSIFNQSAGEILKKIN